MKKIIVILFILSIFSSCQISSPDECYQHIQNEFHKSIVWRNPNNVYGFIVIDTCGGVYYIQMDKYSLLEIKKLSTEIIKYPNQ